MNKFLIIPFVLFVICLSHFHRENNDTKVFQEYLDESFGLSLTEEAALYIIASNFRCSGCVRKTFQQIDLLSVGEKLQNVHVISNDENIIPPSMMKKVTFLNDSLSHFDRLNIGIANATFVAVKNKEVTHIKSVNIDEIDQLVPILIGPYMLSSEFIVKE